MQKERPTTDEYFAKLTLLVSSRSTCIRRMCGAIIVKDKNIISTGYNGAPRGVSHCEEGTCIRGLMNIPSGQNMEMCRGAHAEQNAIAQAAKHGVAVDGATMYITSWPCSMCAKNIINAGIIEIVIVDCPAGCKPYTDDLSMSLLMEAGISMRVVELRNQYEKDEQEKQEHNLTVPQ